MKLQSRSLPDRRELDSSIDPFHYKILQKEFYFQDTCEVARQLLGKGLRVGGSTNAVLVELTEVEAYLSEDAASHSYRGKTKRNWPMFEEGGACYVYLSYGINYCVNVVTQPSERGEAILLRSARPIVGTEKMIQRRGIQEILQLLNGPGKLTQALGIDLRFNGKRFDNPEFCLVDLNRPVSNEESVCTPRIGITKASHLPYRYFIRDSPWISRKGTGTVK